MYNLDIIKDIENFIKPAKNWLFDHYDNPLLWIGIVIGVLGVVGIAYAYLQDRS